MPDQTAEAKRSALINQYPGSKAWAKKVDNMSDAQVTAIYIRLAQQGKIK